MIGAISEFLRLFRNHFGPIPLLILMLCGAGFLLCGAGLVIWHQRGRKKVLLDRLCLAGERLDFMGDRKSYSDEKRKDAEKELEDLERKHGPVTAGVPRLSNRASNPRHTISIAEDEQALHIYKPAFEEALPDTEVLLANNGLEALDQIGRQRPDLIITDIVMPRMNGYEYLKELSARYPDIPVLVVSAYVDNVQQIIDKTGVRNLRLEFLAKPLLCRDLLSAIHRLTDNRLRVGAAGAATCDS
jgi:CheY-like chemotaxis protein